MGLDEEQQRRMKGRYCLLLACKDSEYVMKMYGGYMNVFVTTFGEEGETWDLFRVVDGEFPDMSDIHKYDGFVVSGSPHDAYANDYWILKLCFLLNTLDSMKKKVLGICFGHQVLCRALGGKVGKSSSGWDIGVRKVKISCGSDDSMPMPLPELSIIECHQDEILEIPMGVEVVGVSDKTGVEIFRKERHVLGIQGHPEYTIDILHNLIDRLLSNNCIQESFAEAVRLQLETTEPDRMYWVKICNLFLKGDDVITNLFDY
ncbi:gamma-glutamyl peptidase 3-like [Impatiens glandulifera]|uniref:gamma-glutamyl peptidase 3-like n=1 Tax=Impatiens glandulifera TaxID=253017 RepID=UPI001FB07DB8|nr:gamma-glutamyl peptidase 3-like [Impatiens glandulifera]